MLPGRDQTEVGQAREPGQLKDSERPVRYVEVLCMGVVRTTIFEDLDLYLRRRAASPS